MKKANVIFMTIAGLFLIFGSLLKAHQIITEPVISEGFWESWLFFVILIPLELSLGIWLVSGLFRKAAWLAGTVVFGLFIAVTIQKVLAGAESCGCFGRVHVKPWITLSFIDIPMFLLLLIFRPVGHTLLPPPWPSAKHFFSVAMPSSIIIALLVPTLLFNKPSEEGVIREIKHPTPIGDKQAIDPNTKTAPDDNDVNDVNQVTIQNGAEDPNVEPDPLEGFDPWDKLDNIDIADILRNGRAVVMLYRHDCSTCHEAIPLYDQMCLQMFGLENPILIAFVEVPPYGTEQDNIIPEGTACLTGKLEEKKWYVQTPFVVALQDGIPLKSWEGRAPDHDEILNVYKSFFGE
ncbi:MAG: MauE/DoxX family redox-associated membrane protein [Planctomycetota bacterium]|jgi:hypothetical protein